MNVPRQEPHWWLISSHTIVLVTPSFDYLSERTIDYTRGSSYPLRYSPWKKTIASLSVAKSVSPSFVNSRQTCMAFPWHQGCSLEGASRPAIVINHRGAAEGVAFWCSLSATPMGCHSCTIGRPRAHRCTVLKNHFGGFSLCVRTEKLTTQYEWRHSLTSTIKQWRQNF